MSLAPERVRLPIHRPDPEPDPPRFPLIATLAPIGLALAIWAITRSPYALLFALLGPVVAVAGAWDGRRQRARRRRRSESERRERAATRADAVRAADARERERLTGMVPVRAEDASAVLRRWARSGDPVPVSLGRAEVESVVEVDADEVQEGLADAPLLVDAAEGIALTGPAPLVAALTRSLALQVGASLSPARYRVRAPAGAVWAQALPHEVSVAADGVWEWQGEGRAIRIGPSESEAGVLLHLADGRSPTALLRHPGPRHVVGLRPAYLTAAEAASWAASLRRIADAGAVGAGRDELPDSVGLGGLLRDRPDPPSGSLAVPLGVDRDGAVVVDLVGQGPHALVAGTTGSGKSELLVTWITALARSYPASEVTFLLVDFKGGAAFTPLRAMAHVLGTLTDLDARIAGRAVSSLSAELRRRERLLAEHGVSAIEGLPAGVLARLVVVVDEFAAVVAADADLHAVFADLAARGRSLGLHLILCSQRPTGVVRDAVLANVTLRVSLRVTDRADSIAVIGTDAAAGLSPELRGRALLVDGGPPRVMQVALADPVDWGAESARPDETAIQRPWLEPLPDRLTFDRLLAVADRERAGAIRFGLADLPDQQRQPAVGWDPGQDGALLILGSPGSGRSTLLATLAEAADGQVRVLPRGVADAWQLLTEGVEPGLLLIEDLDLLLARADPEVRLPFIDLVATTLRDAGRELAVAAAARRLDANVQGLNGLFGARMLLRAASRDDHLIAGGDGSRYDPRAPAGRAEWRGMTIQVAIGTRPLPEARPSRPPEVGFGPGSLTALVTTRPRELVPRLAAAQLRVLELGGTGPDALVVSHGEPATIVVGDPDSWNADWSTLTMARRTATMLFDRCGRSDVTALARTRAFPPPLAGAGECWRVDADGVTRVFCAVLS